MFKRTCTCTKAIPELVQGYNSLQSTEFGSHLSWMDRHNQLGIQYNFVVLLCCKYHLDNLSPGQTLCLDIFFLVDTLYNAGEEIRQNSYNALCWVLWVKVFHRNGWK